MEEGEHLQGLEWTRQRKEDEALVRLSPTSEGGPIMSVEELRAFDKAQAFGLPVLEEEEVERILNTFPELA